MRRPWRVTLDACLAGLFLCAGFASPAAAQDNTAGAADSSPQQNAQPAPAAVSQASAQPAPKKVWTNEDMTALREDSRISTFRSPSAKPPNQANNGPKPANPHAKDARWYQNRIAALQQKLPPIDDQIGQLQAALSGQTVNSVRKWGGTRPDDWRVELADLQKKRNDIQAQIAALEDQARHDGVSPNALP